MTSMMPNEIFRTDQIIHPEDDQRWNA